MAGIRVAESAARKGLSRMRWMRRLAGTDWRPSKRVGGSQARRLVGLVAALAMIVGTTSSALGAATVARASGSFDNSLVADKALAYVGQWGGNACRDAGKSQSGQCKQFVNCVIVLAGGGYAGDGSDDYAGSYVRAGGTEITESQAVKGDIIQWGSGTTTYKHTAIVVTNFGGSKFEVVDSNWGAGNHEIVRRHTLANIHSKDLFYGTVEPTRFIRMGSTATADFTSGSFVRVSDGPSAGLISRVVGGYLMGLDTCDPVGGCTRYASISGSEYSAYMAAHPTVGDGAFVRVASGPSSGLVSRAAGGYLFGLESCELLDKCPGAVDVTGGSYTAYVAAHPSVGNGAFVRVASGSRNGLVSRAAGGYLFGLESCDPLDKCPGTVNVTEVAYLGYVNSHTSVADGAFVRVASGPSSGLVSRAVGGYLFGLNSCDPLDKCPGAVDVTGGAYSAYMSYMPSPADGTVVRTLPSGLYWKFASGNCFRSVAVAQAVSINDGTINCKSLSSSTPEVAGTTRVGSNLTITAGTWGPSPVKLSYRWYRSGTAISGAIKTTYTLAGADYGKTITVSVTGSKVGYASITKTSKATSKVIAGSLTAATPTISGATKVGKTFTAKPGSWKPSGVAFTYQWKRNGKAIGGATKAIYKLAKADKGKKITVTVTGHKAGYANAVRTSAKTGKVK